MKEKELKILMKEVENGERELTDDELDMLITMFYERFGNSMYGMSLNPRWLLETKQKENKEKDAVKDWEQQEIYDIFDNKPHLPKEISMDFMCKKPQDCPSHQMNGFSCKCIRKNFENPSQFKEWVDRQMTDLAKELEELLPKIKH
tara:strand:+ start:497 stop:934 length:438 start_codon:yes stop_codon:yes gene_type:complete